MRFSRWAVFERAERRAARQACSKGRCCFGSTRGGSSCTGATFDERKPSKLWGCGSSPIPETARSQRREGSIRTRDDRVDVVAPGVVDWLVAFANEAADRNAVLEQTPLPVGAQRGPRQARRRVARLLGGFRDRPHGAGEPVAQRR